VSDRRQDLILMCDRLLERFDQIEQEQSSDT
jgi:hypothetical protein